MRTYPGVASLADLLRSTLRLRDQTVVGEVRGSEALDLLKAWGPGHPGGLATTHAGSALGALTRLERLILDHALAIMLRGLRCSASASSGPALLPVWSLLS